VDATRGCYAPDLRRIAWLSSILGLWMLPLGLLLLAEDVPPLKTARTRILDWIERRHPNWLVPKV
jgi:hypothetical protein